MYTGKERIAHFRQDQQSVFDEFLIEQHQHGDGPDPFDHRQIRIVRGGERLTQNLFDREPVAPTVKDGGYDDDDSHVSLPAIIERSCVVNSTENIAPPAKELTRVSVLRDPRPALVPRAMTARGRDVKAFSWRGFAAGAAMGSLAAVAALGIISIVV